MRHFNKVKVKEFFLKTLSIHFDERQNILWSMKPFSNVITIQSQNINIGNGEPYSISIQPMNCYSHEELYKQILNINLIKAFIRDKQIDDILND